MSFSDRHIGPDAHETSIMLDTLGVSSLDELIEKAVPASIINTERMNLPSEQSEFEAQRVLAHDAEQNIPLKSFYGQGFSSTITPSVIRRGVLEDAGFYTAYTPYQPEISQGRLEALLNFQTMISELYNLPIANASLLDEATAVAEAISLMSRKVKKGRSVVLDSRLHPQVLSIARERARVMELDAHVQDLSVGLVAEDLVGTVIAYTGTEGDVRDISSLIDATHDRGGLATVVADPMMLVLHTAPGDLGADVCVGTTQRFGVPFFFGGPHAAFMAVTDSLKRQIPGRIVGVSKDLDGFPAYRLALQTREQHIRRDRATSNICTAQALLAVMASMYAVYHGAEGLKCIAREIHRKACSFAAAIESADAKLSLVHSTFFDTVCISTGNRAEEFSTTALEEGYLIRAVDEDRVCVNFGEATTEDDMAALCRIFGIAEDALEQEAESRIEQERADEPLRHEIFSQIHSETQMMRYIRRLGDRDLALDRTMIPLGSCTMKLNPTSAVEPITWPHLADVHPFAPESHTKGWRRIIEDLEKWLAEITGYAKVSVQPNAGSQGELAGLLAIRRYHVSRGDEQRDVCIVPASAHGTNAASAALANLRVVVVATADDGTVDIEDLKAKLEVHAGHVAAIMITYPSTHGVYEENVGEVCELVHEAGGQVYIDGANMNALAGIARPGAFGGDVSHLNLHKTFTIPHGGGGPGVGPIGVAEHLVPFLPTDARTANPHEDAPVGEGVPISATYYGSAGVTPISWMYLRLMSSEGLFAASAHAVLAANYIVKKLEGAYPVLYTGKNGLVAHECIVDLQELTKKSGVTALDVCKRLVDFGFHAPTLAFPVAGTLMVEPTESEDLAELDRFVEAMLVIREEIQEIIDGTVAVEDSVIRKAPFTAASVISDEWNEKFSREKAAFPVPGLRRDKYFPAVRRIDDAYGDRNLVCSCPPPEAFDIDSDHA
ncbi:MULTISPECIES: aminomethyl-transferring glycine dehydrogenase [Corynebacterium]|uniref:aminomethyl-transferring glycine dehydrogenase n=1 Tax=Corynebacterium TaxID=1716 RepID=UPI00124C655C|nr:MULTISPECIES: aminomethyl-transferring glycine dehydrogenase [Corynebacterium]